MAPKEQEQVICRYTLLHSSFLKKEIGNKFNCWDGDKSNVEEVVFLVWGNDVQPLEALLRDPSEERKVGSG